MTEPAWAMEQLRDLIASLGVGSRMENILAAIAGMAMVILLCMVATYVSKGILLQSVQKLISKSKFKWDDRLLKWRVFHRLAHLVPALVLYYLAPVALQGFPIWTAFVVHASIIYMILVGALVLDGALNAFMDVYQDFEMSREIPIKGFVQVVKIVLFLVAGILVLANLLGKNPILLLSGMGALTAVLMLIFKDAILGFVAGIQLTSNKMVAVGNWIEMPKYGADGDVVDVALTTVKVQNWDKTITTIPTYALISDSFKNWRGMSDSGGRRIKRSINMDMQSIRFCTEEMLRRFSKINYITAYLEMKQREIEEFNASRKIDLATLANGRRLTNIGTFRAYVAAYLKDHPMVNQDMTFLVRQLAPTEHGLPIEIYVFCKDKAWANYEGVQSDIFDHILAVVPEFDLRVFQNPSGADFRKIVSAECLTAKSAENAKSEHFVPEG